MRTWRECLGHWVPPGEGTLASLESLARSGGELRLHDMPVLPVSKPVAEGRNEAAGSAEDTITLTARVILYARDNPSLKPNGELFSPLNSPSAVGDMNISMYSFWRPEVVQIWTTACRHPFGAIGPGPGQKFQVEIF